MIPDEEASSPRRSSDEALLSCLLKRHRLIAEYEIHETRDSDTIAQFERKRGTESRRAIVPFADDSVPTRTSEGEKERFRLQESAECCETGSRGEMRTMSPLLRSISYATKHPAAMISGDDITRSLARGARGGRSVGEFANRQK